MRCAFGPLLGHVASGLRSIVSKNYHPPDEPDKMDHLLGKVVLFLAVCLSKSWQ